MHKVITFAAKYGELTRKFGTWVTKAMGKTGPVLGGNGYVHPLVCP